MILACDNQRAGHSGASLIFVTSGAFPLGDSQKPRGDQPRHA